MMEAGVPKDLAMKAAGHRNPEIHDIYTNIDQRIARQLAEALDRLHESPGRNELEVESKAGKTDFVN